MNKILLLAVGLVDGCVRPKHNHTPRCDIYACYCYDNSPLWVKILLLSMLAGLVILMILMVIRDRQ